MSCDQVLSTILPEVMGAVLPWAPKINWSHWPHEGNVFIREGSRIILLLPHCHLTSHISFMSSLVPHLQSSGFFQDSSLSLSSPIVLRTWPLDHTPVFKFPFLFPPLSLCISSHPSVLPERSTAFPSHTPLVSMATARDSGYAVCKLRGRGNAMNISTSLKYTYNA